MGSNLNMTRTPDCHFAAEARHNGSKMWVFSPDFSQVAKYADEWVSINAGQDGAWWMAVNHVLLKEFHHERPVPYFLDYAKRYTDAPYLDGAEAGGRRLPPGTAPQGATRGSLHRGGSTASGSSLMWDERSDRPRMPMGSSGFRWGKTKGKWNLKLEDGQDGSPIDPALTFLDRADEVLRVSFDDFAEGGSLARDVPVRWVETADGERLPVATIYDVLMAQYGVARGLGGDYPASYDEDAPYTPAWAERFTRHEPGDGGPVRPRMGGHGREDGRSVHDHHRRRHQPLVPRQPDVPGRHPRLDVLRLRRRSTGAGWRTTSARRSWPPASPGGRPGLRQGLGWPTAGLQNAPSWHYVHTDQWRYEKSVHRLPHGSPSPPPLEARARPHDGPRRCRAVRSGWLPFYPQFDRNTLDLVREARESGAETEADVVAQVVDRLKSGDVKFAVEDPDAPEKNWLARLVHLARQPP